METTTDSEPTHYTDSVTKCVVRTESQVEREKREAAYFLNVVWPEIDQTFETQRER